MKIMISDPKSWQRIVNVEIPVEEVDKEYEEKIKKYKKEVSLPGFRPGKVPITLIKSRFDRAIKVQVVDDLVQKTFKNACAENKINPVSEAKITEIQAEDNQPITYKAEVEVDPVLEITGYKDLNIAISVPPVEEKDIDLVIEDMRKRLAETKEIDGPSQKGDLIHFEYLSYTFDGLAQQNIPNPKYPIEIGVSSLPDLDNALIGLVVGQEKEFAVTYPDDYYAKDYAGKTAVSVIKVTRLMEKKLPEINDDFLKKIGNYENVESLRKKIYDDLSARNVRQAHETAQNEAIQKILDKNDFDVPPSRIERYIDLVTEEESKYYPAGKGPDRKDIDSQFRQIGILAIKRHRIIEYISRKENIKVTQEEVDNRIREWAVERNREFDEFKAELRKQGSTLQLREELVRQKVLNSLIGIEKWESL